MVKIMESPYVEEAPSHIIEHDEEVKDGLKVIEKEMVKV